MPFASQFLTAQPAPRILAQVWVAARPAGLLFDLTGQQVTSLSDGSEAIDLSPFINLTPGLCQGRLYYERLAQSRPPQFAIRIELHSARLDPELWLHFQAMAQGPLLALLLDEGGNWWIAGLDNRLKLAGTNGEWSLALNPPDERAAASGPNVNLYAASPQPIMPLFADWLPNWWQTRQPVSGQFANLHWAARHLPLLLLEDLPLDEL